ncbi:MmgE/PrpD family protein [Alicyclobacillus mengziensis]|uniref:MmgE/PrpD family protein n=1 Tax=Alicyclobacillus mengziensis TaxID=2931921 RepID=UPI0020114309|nr:MmgE/PrpD family protein [Alicyclobacillus mengziensis]
MVIPLEELIKFSVNSRFDDVPPPVIHQMKRSLVLMIGNCVAISNDSTMEQLMKMSSDLDHGGKIGALGMPTSLPLSWTAFIYGYASHQAHLDDVHKRSLVSPTSPVASAVIAFAHNQRLSGQEMLLAVVLGTEVAVRTGLVLGPAHRQRGWYPTATAGYVGAITAGAKARNLDLLRFTHALGLASLATGTIEPRTSAGLGLTVGRAAYNAANAVLLAEGGFTSSVMAVVGRKGYLNVASHQPDLELLSGGLGETWHIPDIVVKPMPYEPELYPVLLCASLLGMQLKNMQSRCKRVDVWLPETLLDYVSSASGERNAWFQYTLQRTVQLGTNPGNINSLEDGHYCLNDDEIPLVTFHVNRELHLLETNMVATLIDGSLVRQHVTRTHEEYLNLWKGISDEELSNRFTHQVSRRMKPNEAHELLDTLWHLDEVKDVSELFT